MSKWIELKLPIFAWIRYGDGGTIFPAVFHGVISQQELKDIFKRYDLSADEASLPLDELARRYPIDGPPPAKAGQPLGDRNLTEGLFEDRLSTVTFILGVSALLLFMVAAFLLPA